MTPTTMPVHRYGIGGAASIELELRGSPIVVAARYEQGFTELSDGVHEHALVFEIEEVDRREFLIVR